MIKLLGKSLKLGFCTIFKSRRVWARQLGYLEGDY